MPDGTKERLPRNVTTRREFQRLARYWADQIGFPHPWKVFVRFHDASKGDQPHDSDPMVYACAMSQPQYHRVFLDVDLRHAGWTAEPTVAGCIRHELFHAFVSLYTQTVAHLVKDAAMEATLEDLEDELVNRLCQMPLLRHVPEA